MSQRFCTQCGSELPANGNFCPQCGAPVEQDSGDAPAMQAVAREPDPAGQLDAELAAQSMSKTKQSGSSNALLYTLAGAGLVVVLLVAAYFAFLRPGGAATADLSDCGDEPCTIEAVTAAVQTDPDVPYPEIVRISPDDAHMLLARDSAVFVDVRDIDSYTSLHIPGALSIPLDEIAARLDELPPDAEIVTYCT